jgi:xanthine/uracil/vitamin C permease (AzgA family)
MGYIFGFMVAACFGIGLYTNLHASGSLNVSEAVVSICGMLITIYLMHVNWRSRSGQNRDVDDTHK